MRTFATRFLWRITLIACVFCAIGWRANAASASFTWDPSPDAATGKVTGYKVYYSTLNFISLPPDVATNPAFTIVPVTSGASVTLTLIDGQTYFMTVTAFDANGQESVPSNILTYAAGQLPPPPLTVAITDPTAAVSVSSSSTVTITATATGPAAISKVEFFDGTTLLATKTAAPYTFSQTFAAGAHIITAKATDVNNTTATSAPVTITSTVAIPLTVAITPAGSISVSSTATVTFTATASGPAPITKVEFFDESSLLATTTALPYAFSQTFSAGLHFITAKATDVNNMTATSEVVIIVSTAPPPPPDNLPPIVSLVGVTSGALLSQPVVLSASAEDIDGTVTSVEFFANSSSLGIVTAPPYTISPRLISGTYTLKAKATDNFGGVSFSPIITVSVKPPPPVDLTIK